MAAVMAVMAVTVGMLVAAPTDVDMSALMLKRTAAGREAERSTAKWMVGIEASEAMEALVVRSGVVRWRGRRFRGVSGGREPWARAATGVGASRTKFPAQKGTSWAGRQSYLAGLSLDLVNAVSAPRYTGSHSGR